MYHAIDYCTETYILPTRKFFIFEWILENIDWVKRKLFPNDNFTSDIVRLTTSKNPNRLSNSECIDILKDVGNDFMSMLSNPSKSSDLIGEMFYKMLLIFVTIAFFIFLFWWSCQMRKSKRKIRKLKTKEKNPFDYKEVKKTINSSLTLQKFECQHLRVNNNISSQINPSALLIKINPRDWKSQLLFLTKSSQIKSERMSSRSAVEKIEEFLNTSDNMTVCLSLEDNDSEDETVNEKNLLDNMTLRLNLEAVDSEPETVNEENITLALEKKDFNSTTTSNASEIIRSMPVEKVVTTNTAVGPKLIKRSESMGVLNNRVPFRNVIPRVSEAIYKPMK